MMCERCKKEKAKTIFQKQKLCESCLCYVKGELKIFRDYKCKICGEIFNTALRPFIPLCSTDCIKEFDKRLKCFEEAFKLKYEASNNGGEI